MTTASAIAGGPGTGSPNGSPRTPRPVAPRDLIAQVTEPTTAAMVVLLGAAFVWTFKAFLARQHEHSWGNGDWSHAYMVPFISLYLLWQNKAGLERMKFAPYWPGLAAMLTGIACYVFFLVGTASNHLGQGLAMVLTLFGLVLMMLGPRAMEFCFLPIAYLLFGITIPEKVMNIVTWPLQHVAAQGAYVVLNMVGVATKLVGNTLQVTDSNGFTYPLNVAQACSGMRMLIGFLALGAAVGLVASRLWWKRVVLFALGVPLALLLNILRVAVLGVATLFNPNLASGQAHTFIGTLLLVPGFAIYMLILWALIKSVPEQPAPAGGKA